MKTVDTTIERHFRVSRLRLSLAVIVGGRLPNIQEERSFTLVELTVEGKHGAVLACGGVASTGRVMFLDRDVERDLQRGIEFVLKDLTPEEWERV